MTAPDACQLRQDEVTLTVRQVAERGDWLRLVCLDCKRRREFSARDLVGRHGGKIVSTLKPRCEPCARSGRKGTGLHKPGYGTYIELLPRGDAP